jgi:DNA-directed RNA polymerase specialized sigma24 family protein
MRDPRAVEAFCQAYANTGNATSAFIAAHPNAAAWKRRSAARKAVDMMRRADVQARIAELSDLIRAQATKAFIAELEVGAEERRRALVSGILATLSGHERA